MLQINYNVKKWKWKWSEMINRNAKCQIMINKHWPLAHVHLEPAWAPCNLSLNSTKSVIMYHHIYSSWNGESCLKFYLIANFCLSRGSQWQHFSLGQWCPLFMDSTPHPIELYTEQAHEFSPLGGGGAMAPPGTESGRKKGERKTTKYTA